MVVLALPTLGSLPGCQQEGPAQTNQQRNEKAQQLEQTDQLNAAAIEYKNALQQDPSNVQARLALGRLHLAFGDAAAAEKELLAVSETLPEGEVAADLAQARLLSGRYGAIVTGDAEQSLAEITVVPGLEPVDRPRLKAFYGHAFLGLDQNNDARRMFDDALADDATEPYALLGQALLSLAAGDVPAARSTLERTLTVHPDFVLAWSYSGDLERAQHNLPAAEAAYSKAIALSKNPVPDLMERALTRFALKDYPGALADAKQLSTQASAGWRPDFIRGLVAFQQQDYANAEQEFRATLALDGSYLPAVLYAGLTAAARGNLEQAREFLLRYTAANPTNTVTLMQLAGVLARLKDYAAAKATVDRVLAIDPADGKALDFLGVIELAQGRPEEAGIAFARLAQQAPESADAHLKLGTALAAGGKRQQANQAWTTALELQAKDESAPETRARALLSQGKSILALDIAEELTRTRPDSAAFLLLGQVHQARDELDPAAAALDRAIALDSTNTRAVAERGRVALAQGKPTIALPLLRQAVAAEPKNIATALQLATALGNLRRAPEAIGVLEAAGAANPQAWQPTVILARYYRMNNDAPKALALLNSIPDASRDNPLVLDELGLTQLASGEADRAIETLSRLVQIAPGSALAHYRLAEAQAATNATDQAKASLAQAIKLDPQAVEPKIVLARMALAANDIATATPLIDALAKTQAKNPDVQSLAGAAAMQRGDARAAAAAYQKAMELAPSSGAAVALTLAQLRSNDVDGGMKTLQDWVDAHPEDQGGRLSLGNAAMLVGRTEVAKTAFQTLISQGAGTSSAHHNLAQILLAEGNSDQALMHATTAISLDPQSAQLKDSLGLILLTRKDYALALDAFTKAETQAPGNPSFMFHQAVALDALDRQKEADAILTKIAVLDQKFPESDNAKELHKRVKTAREQAGASAPKP